MARQKQKTRRRRRTRIRPRTTHTIGVPPGTLEVAAGAVPPSIRFMRFGPDQCEEGPLPSIDSLAGLVGALPVTWIDIVGTGDVAAMKRLGELFGLHALALEDVMHGNQRPKLEDYPGHTFLVLRMPEGGGEALEFDQLSVFVGPSYVITVQERPGDCLDQLRERIRQGLGRVRREAADYLAYCLMDAVVDSFFPLLETYGDRLESLELRALEGIQPQTAAEVHGIRYDLRVIRRVLWSTRELLNALQRSGHERFSAGTQPFLRDCHDHTGQLLDIVGSSQDLARGLMELNQSTLSMRANEIMKVLTMVSTVFIPLSFIAGIYGMNFDPDASTANMPELRWRYGYLFALATMALTALGFLWYFRRKGWLGAPPSDVEPPRAPPIVPPGQARR